MLRLMILALALPLEVSAQTPPDSTKPVGNVRLFFRDGRRWDGAELLMPVGDLIVVRGRFDSSRNPPVTRLVNPASVAHLELRVPRSREEGAMKGAKIGAVVGLLAGAAISAPSFNYCDPDSAPGVCIGRAMFVVGTALSTVVGTGVGAAIGSTSNSKWVCVPNAPCNAWPPTP